MITFTPYLVRPVVKPFNYQLQGVSFAHSKNGRVLICDEMGLGKSLQALLYAKENKLARPVIVVCPANVKTHWQHEAFVHIGMRSEILQGRKSVRANRKTLARYPMLIVNYEILHAWLPYLLSLNPQLVIIDEIHRVKSPTVKCSKAVRELCEQVPHILALGGTPLENRPTELWNICNILQPKHKKFRSYWKFGLEFSKPVKQRGRWTFKGAKNTKRLHRLLTRTIMIRRLKEDVLDQLPKKTRIVLPVAMDNPREYEQAKHNFRAWLRKNKPAKARVAGKQGWKAQQMTQLGYLKQLAARLKLKAVTDWIDNYFEETEKKLVVFAIHHEIVDKLKERYKDCCVTLTGKTSKRERLSAVEQFIKDKRVKLFIGNVQAAGTGVNGLQHATDTSLTIELDWKSTTHDQADKRLDRLGQTAPVSCYYLVAKDSIEQTLCEIQQTKRQMLGAIMDGKEDGGSELDIFDQLCAALEKEKEPKFRKGTKR